VRIKPEVALATGRPRIDDALAAFVPPREA
jgi:hypothetical protein